MFPHDGGLLLVEWPRLIEDITRHTNFADVVQECPVLEEPQRLGLETQSLANRARQRGSRSGVHLSVAVLRVQRDSESLDGGQVTSFKLQAAPFGELILATQCLADEGGDEGTDRH